MVASKIQQRVTHFADQVRTGRVDERVGDLNLGIDLGTANIVLSVVDDHNTPIAGAWRHSTVVRDGIVVDWVGAVRAVRELKEELEGRLTYRFTTADVAVPPGISPGTVKVFTNVLEAAGMSTRRVVDEPVAAAQALEITDGCVIDIGHGTTGVSVLSDGKVTLSVDEPTGGHHMTLVLAGAFHLPYDEAEDMKKTRRGAEEVFGVIRPVVEKMATIARRAIGDADVGDVYLVGGASSLSAAPDVFSEILERTVIHPAEPLFVTPLGIAMTSSDSSAQESTS